MELINIIFIELLIAFQVILTLFLIQKKKCDFLEHYLPNYDIH